MLRSHVIAAVFKRNFWSYFSGVIGYLFIVAFVLVGSLIAFREQFFNNNLANLDQLNEQFPLLLLFIIPAITMGVWSDEKKLGTEELLLTLPVSDLEVLLGKYFAVLAVYTVTLLFSLSHVAWLSILGNPDPWQLVANYLGFWLAGASLLTAGMVASFLTSSTTVAFVLGVLFCAVPVYVPGLLSQALAGTAADFSLASQFEHFGRGVFSYSALLYFLAFGGWMLYINAVLLARRHWQKGESGNDQGLQYALRSLAIGVSLGSVFLIGLSRAGQVDFTSEQLFTVTPTTANLLRGIDKDRPVMIQAFVSKDMPREYVPVKTRLLGLLDKYPYYSKNGVSVRVTEVEPFSAEADRAKEFGIEARKVQSDRNGRVQVDDVFLGAVINSGANEVVIPFFDIAIPIEYELTRSVGTAANAKRRKVGILETDAKLNGGFDMSSFRSSPEWRIVTELKKQYEVETVSAARPIDPAKYDVVLAVMPSSLKQDELGNFVEYVRSGKPVLIFDDPVPATNLQVAPRQPKPRAGGMFGGQSMPEQKAEGGRLTSLVNLLGIQWNFDEVVWDNSMSVLHPEFSAVVRPEMVAVSPRTGVADALSPTNPITSGLQEVLLFFPGSIRPRENSELKFDPLLRTGKVSGTVAWDDLVSSGSPFGGGLDIAENPRRRPDPVAHVIGARIQSSDKSEGDKVNAIFVADMDMIADWFFMVRERKLYDLDLDNVTFVLNAVDVLAGDTSFVDLRKRRAQHRTLTLIEKETAIFTQQQRDEQQKAADSAQTKLEEAKKRFSDQVKKVLDDPALSEQERLQKELILRENEQQRIRVQEAKIDQEKERAIELAKNQSRRKIHAIQDRYFAAAVATSPIPAVLLGLWVWFWRTTSEQKDISPARRKKR